MKRRELATGMPLFILHENFKTLKSAQNYIETLVIFSMIYKEIH